MPRILFSNINNNNNNNNNDDDDDDDDDDDNNLYSGNFFTNVVFEKDLRD